MGAGRVRIGCSGVTHVDNCTDKRQALFVTAARRVQLFQRRLSERIKDVAMAREISIAGLARSYGFSRQQIHDWCAGRREPRLANVVRLARALGVTTDWLLGTRDRVD